MDTSIMTNNVNFSNDPFSSYSSLYPTTTFLDLLTNQWPWAEPKLRYTSEPPPRPPQPTLTEAEIEALKYHLASPLPSPTNFFFEFEPETMTHELCFDDFPETEVAANQLVANAESSTTAATPQPTPTPSTNELPTCIAPEMLFQPTTNSDDLFDFTFLDSPEGDFFFDAASTPGLVPSSPSSSSSGTISSCPTPDSQGKTWIEIQDDDDLESVDNPMDGDYKPFQIQNCSPMIRKKTSKKSKPQPQPSMTNYAEESFPGTLKLKTKRKAPAMSQDTFRNAKRQKYDAEAICRIHGCRHVSKTRFECFKHRETHFPGRFQCPQPKCRKVFVRSSSLARHLKRPRNAECSAYAGTQEEWGTGLINFALHPPEWLVPGFLDDITEV